MNTVHIEQLLKNDPYTERVFKGAFARDQLSKVVYPSAYVVNTRPISQPGEHWIAIYFDKTKTENVSTAMAYHLKYMVWILFWIEIRSDGLTTKRHYKFIFCNLWTLLYQFYFILLSWFYYEIHYVSLFKEPN